jgi:hypothetical protein
MPIKTDHELQTAGFTESGRSRFYKTIDDYALNLFEKSVALGIIDKSKDAPIEITHDHVRASAIFLSLRKQEIWKHFTLFQIGEYLCAVAAGVGGGKLDKTWGILLFGASIVVWIALFVTRNNKGSK